MTRSERRAIVVGAGIGGLAAAIALGRRGWQVEVLERATEFGEVGSGLSLWANGLHALDAIGLGAEVRARAMTETEAGIRDFHGRWLAQTDIDEVTRRYGPLVMIHRADLFDILRKALPDDAVRLGTTVTGLESDATGARVLHSAGESHADLVIGADGISSTIRTTVWPNSPAPTYAGYTAWRMITRPIPRLTAGGVTWGRGERFGIAPLPDGRAYLFAVANATPGQQSPDTEYAEVHRRFAHWHTPIPTLLAAVDPKAVLRHDIYDLPPLPTYVTDRVALLGDAAHAMTPNLGQGANQALEDAITLAALLEQSNNLTTALTDYDRQRRPRTQMIVRRSRRLGIPPQWTWPPLVAARNLGVRLTPPRAALRTLGPILDWNPPS